MKPGYKTSEFWLSLLAMLLGAFVASGAFGQEHWAVQVAGFVLSALASLGYSVSRGQAKAALPPAGG